MEADEPLSHKPNEMATILPAKNYNEPTTDVFMDKTIDSNNIAMEDDPVENPKTRTPNEYKPHYCYYCSCYYCGCRGVVSGYYKPFYTSG